MMKKMMAGTIALVIAGAGLALAQSTPPRDGPRWRPSAEDISAMTDARVAGLKVGTEAHRRAGEELARGRDRDPRSRQAARRSHQGVCRPHGGAARRAARRLTMRRRRRTRSTGCAAVRIA